MSIFDHCLLSPVKGNDMSEPIITVDARTYYKRKPDKSRTLEIDFTVSAAIDCSLLIQVADPQGLVSHEIKIRRFTPAQPFEFAEYLVDEQLIVFILSMDEEKKEKLSFEVRDHETLLVPICQNGGAFQFRIVKGRQTFRWEDEGAA